MKEKAGKITDMLIVKSIYLSAIWRVFKATRKGISITKKGTKDMEQPSIGSNKPTTAYIGATWGALGIGIICYLMGLWNAEIELNEKGFYLAVFLLAMFAAVSLQKSVRDREEGFPVTNGFVGLCWAAFAASIALLVVGLVNADMLLSEKGFYGMAFVLSLFSCITVQKNIRDMTNKAGVTDPAAYPSPENGLDLTMDAADIIDQ